MVEVLIDKAYSTRLALLSAMPGAIDYDGSVALDIASYGKLTDEEIKDLKCNSLQPLFGTMDEDVSDILDYTFAVKS